jgi:putative DNA primase/helicase
MKTDRKQVIIDSGIFREVVPQLFPDAKTTATDQVLVCCPFHHDTTPSLSVNTEAGLHHCFACGEAGNGFDLYSKVKGCDFKTALAELEELAGISRKSTVQQFPKVVATFIYHDAEGQPRYWKKRFEPGFDGRKKSFVFYHATGKTENKGRGGDALPYNLHRLAAIPPDEPIFFLEGEAKADLLTEWGLYATSLDSGGQSGKGASWSKKWDRFFAGREVYILPDFDDTGEVYAKSLAAHLLPVAASVKVLRLPGLPVKGDVIDWYKRERCTA